MCRVPRRPVCRRRPALACPLASPGRPAGAWPGPSGGRRPARRRGLAGHRGRASRGRWLSRLAAGLAGVRPTDRLDAAGRRAGRDRGQRQAGRRAGAGPCWPPGQTRWRWPPPGSQAPGRRPRPRHHRWPGSRSRRPHRWRPARDVMISIAGMSWGWTRCAFCRARDTRSLPPRGAAVTRGCDQAGAHRCAAGQGGGLRGSSAHRARLGASGHQPCPIRTISSARNPQNEAMTWFTKHGSWLESIFELTLLAAASVE